jgi:nuclear pore complex protein Nup62
MIEGALLTMFVCVYICVYIYICVCVCVCVYTYVCVYIYIYIYDILLPDILVLFWQADGHVD